MRATTGTTLCMGDADADVARLPTVANALAVPEMFTRGD